MANPAGAPIRVHFWLPGNPVPHNACWDIVRAPRGRPILRLTPRGRAYRTALALVARADMARQRLEVAPAHFDVTVWLWLYYDRRDHSAGPWARPQADVDGPVKPILDALEGAVYTNDRQVVALHVRKAFNRKKPGVVGTVEISPYDRPAGKPRRSPAEPRGR